MTTSSPSGRPEISGLIDGPTIDRLRSLLQDTPGNGSAQACELLERLLDRYEQSIQGTEQLRTELAELAHKINNPLTSLIGRSQLLQMSAGSDPGALKAAEVIEESANRIAQYVRDLAAIAHRAGG